MVRVCTPLYHQDQDTSLCRMLKPRWHGWNSLGEASKRAGRNFSIVTISLHSQVEPLLQCIYAFKYMLVLLLLLSLITERNLREMNDAQALAYGILHGSRVQEFVHISIYMNFIAVSWLQLAGILSTQINRCSRCDSQIVDIQRD